MRYSRIVFILGLVLMIFAGCTKEEIQPDPLNTDESALKGAKVEKGPDHFVPFKGVFDVSVVAVHHIPPPPPRVQDAAGSGNATHLGKTEVLINQNWYPPGPPPYDFPWTGTGNGLFTFTAANGDLLTAEYTGMSIHNSATEVEIHFICTITGGSGRFANAEGSFKWTGEYDPTVNIGNAVVVGEIKY